MLKMRRSIKLAKGLRVNIGKKGVTSLSVGGKGLTLNASKKGVKATTSIRGTGLSASDYIIKSQPSAKTETRSHGSNTGSLLLWFVVFCFILWLFAS